jgi:hypothetical protein
MRYYIAGPMSGLPQFNFPLFIAAAEALRAAGFDIVSPAETDPEDVRQVAMGSPDGKYDASGKVGHETWGDMLARDVKMLADGICTGAEDFDDKLGNTLTRDLYAPIDGIVFLPGWENSKGARLEAFVGILTGKRFALYDPEARDLTPVFDGWVKSQLALSWADDIALYAPYKGRAS